MVHRVGLLLWFHITVVCSPFLVGPVVKEGFPRRPPAERDYHMSDLGVRTVCPRLIDDFAIAARGVEIFGTREGTYTLNCVYAPGSSETFAECLGRALGRHYSFVRFNHHESRA